MEIHYIVSEANPKVKAPGDLVSAEAVPKSSLGKPRRLELSVREDGGPSCDCELELALVPRQT